MKTKFKVLMLGVSSALLAGAMMSAPAKADPPDASFLPQCPNGQIFGILSGRCIPWDGRDEQSHSGRGLPNVPATPPSPPAPPPP